MQSHLKIFKWAMMLILSVLTMTGCSNDEPVNPEVSIPNVNEDGYIDMNGDGGTITFDVEANTDWYISSPDGGTFEPDHGSKGTTKVSATFPPNPYTDGAVSYTVEIYTSDGNCLNSFQILQGPSTLFEMNKDQVSLPQEESSISVSIEANAELTVTVPDADLTWLSYEITPASNSRNKYNLEFKATQNPSLNERESVVTVSCGKLQKQITITQDGGILLSYSIINEQTAEEIKGNLPPTSGSYILSIESNSPWNYSIDSNEEGITISKITQDLNNAKFKIQATEIAKEDNWRTIIFKITFENGEEKDLQIRQNDWSLSLYVTNGESLSSAISKIQNKINDGYRITSLNIDRGVLDRNAPGTVVHLDVKNVDNIPERFCASNKNLKSLTLTNVKRIGAYAFQSCVLSSITIPASVTYIGDGAFRRSGATYPYVTCYNPTPPTLGHNIFHDGTGSGLLRVPMGSKPKYKANTSWSREFSEIEEF